MPVIQGGRWQRYLQKLLGIKAEVVASELAPEIYAVAPIYPLPPENAILEGSRLYFAPVTQAALANNNSVVGLFNPAASNVLATIERFHVRISTTLQSLLITRYLGPAVAAPTTLSAGVIRDQRTAGSSSNNFGSACVTVAQNNYASGNSGPRVPTEFFSGTTSLYRLIEGRTDQVVLLPGTGFICVTDGTAGGEGLDGGIWWRERQLESSEIAA